MRHLRQLSNEFSISLQPDEDGYLGRECPKCESYFKITTGTGIEGEPPCHCPYCGHCAKQHQFFTKAQIEYAQSVVINKVSEAVIEDLNLVEGRPEPIQHYRELQLEEEVVCDNCTLRYTIFGSFAFCPDCGRHNSRQILEKNLSLAEKMIGLADQVESDLSNQLVADSLENGVSAFDGFGREICRVHASKASDAKKAENISFQNLTGAQKNVQNFFAIDLAAGLDDQDWSFVCRCFQKRHLLAHKMGVVDDAYLKATDDPHATVGRKVTIHANEVTEMLGHVRMLGTYLTAELETLP